MFERRDSEVQSMTSQLSRRRLLAGGGATLLTGTAVLGAAPQAQALRWYYPESDYPKLKIGMVHPLVGEGVHCLRGDLYFFGYRNQRDRNSHRFDLWVQAAVQKLQRRFGAETDGVVGPKTWGLIEANRSGVGYPKLRRGDREDGVFVLQRVLVATVRVSLDNDGVFGGATDAAVRSYQRSRGLAVDGVVGPKTWAKMRSGR